MDQLHIAVYFDYMSGNYTVKEIAEKHNFRSLAMIYYILKKMGSYKLPVVYRCKQTGGRQKKTRKEWYDRNIEIIERYNIGDISMTKLAKEYNISRQRIAQIIIEYSKVT